jgi:hypothetical protein
MDLWNGGLLVPKGQRQNTKGRIQGKLTSSDSTLIIVYFNHKPTVSHCLRNLISSRFLHPFNLYTAFMDDFKVLRIELSHNGLPAKIFRPSYGV